MSVLGQTMDDKSRGKAKQTEDWIKLLVCSILRCLSPLLSIQARISLDIIFRCGSWCNSQEKWIRSSNVRATLPLSGFLVSFPDPSVAAAIEAKLTPLLLVPVLVLLVSLWQ